MFIPNFDDSLKDFTQKIFSEAIEWENCSNQLASKKVYDKEKAQHIVKMITIHLNLNDFTLSVEKKSPEGFRVVIKDLPCVSYAIKLYSEKINNSLAQMKQSACFISKTDVKEAEELLNVLCSTSWSGNKYTAGEILRKKYPCLSPCREITIKTLPSNNYQIDAISTYSPMYEGDPNYQKSNIVSGHDVKYIIKILKK